MSPLLNVISVGFSKPAISCKVPVCRMASGRIDFSGRFGRGGTDSSPAMSASVEEEELSTPGAGWTIVHLREAVSLSIAAR